MSTQLAFPSAAPGALRRFRLPPAIPPFNSVTLRIFSLLWFLAFLIALMGPIAGFYLRYTAPSNNSQLIVGSRAGFAVSPRDATIIRFTVGPQAKKAGLVAGDHIVAIFGLPLPKTMPMNEEELAAHQEDPAYITMGNLLYGTDETEVPLTVRDPDGHVRDVTVTTGEQHIDAGAAALGISAKLLSFIDLLPVLAYPFLLWAAWILHRRNSRDVVSSILSIAVLFTIAAEQPSSVFLAYAGVPRWLNVALYDLGNVMLLAGILLFPHGNLSWKMVGLLVSLPILMFLHGQAYQSFFVCFMILGVLLLLRSLRKSESAEMRQQVRWALLGFTGYALLHGLSITADYMKWATDSFGHQLLVELLAGISFAFGVMILQFGLLIALLRYRLYDADVAISRSANFALITLSVAAIFAAAQDVVKQIVFNYSGDSSSDGPIIFAAALATMLVNPIQERIQKWSERRFQNNLFILRGDLPESVRDLRETASLDEMLSDILRRIEEGVRSVRSAFIVEGRILETRDVTVGEVEEWRAGNEGYTQDHYHPKDRMFPLRVALIPSSDRHVEPVGYILVGPRPDGSIPSKEEQKALHGVSETIARAILTVIKRERREREVADSIADTNRRIDAIESLLGTGIKRSPKTA